MHMPIVIFAGKLLADRVSTGYVPTYLKVGLFTSRAGGSLCSVVSLRGSQECFNPLLSSIPIQTTRMAAWCDCNVRATGVGMHDVHDLRIRTSYCTCGECDNVAAANACDSTGSLQRG